MSSSSCRLLAISNGHGEDEIAVRILEQCRDRRYFPEIAALAMVGEGHAYRRAQIPLVIRPQSLPSGGFIYMDSRQLWRDLRGGLLGFTEKQFRVIRQWGKEGGKILAVGDLIPLLMAWLSGAEYSFVGTAKSDYYLRNDGEWLASTKAFDRLSGSFYYPWERWLMARPRCRSVFVRDSLTGKVLQNSAIPVYDLGNPMMDGLDCPNMPPSRPETLTLLLLPGSRSPEANRNWQLILQSLPSVVDCFSDRNLLFLAALAPSLNRDRFIAHLSDRGWIACEPRDLVILEIDRQALGFSQNSHHLILSQHAYACCLQASQMAIAMAGTATEQFAGLGKPAVTIVGEGPQFTPTFARNQTRLLGCSVTLVETPDAVGSALRSLWEDPQKRKKIAENGKKRLGKSGAARRIADCLQQTLLTN